jgi:hypothetical protein
MISDATGTGLVSQLAALQLVPHGTNLGVTVGENGAGFIQPVTNVLERLKTRRPRPCFEGEEDLLITLTEDGQEEVKALNMACLFVKNLSKGKHGLSVSAACERALSLYANNRWLRKLKPKTFRETYDLWAKQGDWVALVNIAKAPAKWKPEHRGLSDAFLDYVSKQFAEYKRQDGKFQAVESIKKIWRTGRNEYGEEEIIPGYEKGWSSRVRELYPDGWHYTNIMRQLNKRAKFTKAVRAALHEGTSAAKEHLPHNLRTRKDLRFLEEVTFDDVRTDWLIFDPETGKPCELWLLVARDTATTMILGFVMHPARAREDGAASHLGLKEMKQLAAWLLERYPLPKDYIVHWIVERGTATLSEGSARALQEFLPNRIQVHYTSMVGGKSATGYAEKRKGNSKGKASHESHNRLIHTQSSYIQGQTGSRYEIRPADLSAKRKDGSGRGRVEECIEIWEMRNQLPEHLRGREKYPLLIPSEAREHLTRIFIDQNFRTEHAIEGFEKVLEWFDGAQWRDRSEWKGEPDVKWKPRKERPVERAARLIAGHEWEHVSPEVIIAFLKHTVKQRPVEGSGEISLTVDETRMIFAPAKNATVPAEETKVLCYFNEDDTQFLHVTTGTGSILGTWYRRGRNTKRDEAALQQAFRYTAAALAVVQQRAEQLVEPERQRLDAMRAHNTELERGNDYIDIAKPELAIGDSTISAPIAHALAKAVPTEKKRAKKAKDEQTEKADASRRALAEIE